MERPCAPQGQPTPKSPTTRVAAKAKYYFYISRGGTPRGGGRRRRQSTAVWLKRPTENFTSVSPFEGPMNIFSSAPPLKAETHGPPRNFSSAPPLKAETQKVKKKNGRSSPLSRGDVACGSLPLAGTVLVLLSSQPLRVQHRGIPVPVFLHYTKSGAHADGSSPLGASHTWPLRRCIGL